MNQKELEALLASSGVQSAFMTFAKYVRMLPDPSVMAGKRSVGIAHFANSVIIYSIDELFRQALKKRGQTAKLLKSIKVLECQNILGWNPDLMGNPAYPTLDLVVYEKMKALSKGMAA